MESGSISTKPLTKEESKILLSFIENSKIINSKATNATTNKMKAEEWKCIANKFNAIITSAHRTPQQLRLKWENMKKNSRKRKTMIRMNSLKTGGGCPDYIPPDEVLDRVATLLGNTVDGLPDEFGGDAITISLNNSQSGTLMEVGDAGFSGVGGESTITVIGGDGIIENDIEKVQSSPKVIDVKAINLHNTSTPRASGYKRRLNNDDNRAIRNMAISKYYEAKTKLVEENLENIRLQNIKLKLEIESMTKKINL